MVLLTANHNDSFYHARVVASMGAERYEVAGVGVKNILRGLDRFIDGAALSTSAAKAISLGPIYRSAGSAAPPKSTFSQKAVLI